MQPSLKEQIGKILAIETAKRYQLLSKTIAEAAESGTHLATNELTEDIAVEVVRAFCNILIIAGKEGKFPVVELRELGIPPLRIW